MLIHDYLGRSLLLSAFGLLLACSPACKPPNLDLTDDGIERDVDDGAANSQEAQAGDEVVAPSADRAEPDGADPNEPSEDGRSSDEPDSNEPSPSDANADGPQKPASDPDTLVDDAPNGAPAVDPLADEDSGTEDEDDDAPEFPSGSFGVSDDSGELEMLLGLREIPSFRIDDLLTNEDVRTALGMRSPQTRASLAGATPSPYYNHLRFIAEDSDELGIVLQYWHFKSTTAATTHYRMLERSAPSEAKPVGVASESFFTDFEGVTQLVGVDYDLPAVIAISCETKGCHVPQLMQWMRNAIQRAND